MHKVALTPLLVLLCHASLSHADVEQLGDSENEMIIDQATLKSISHLQSLKNLEKKQSYQAPFVQDLSNTLKVRTLFVATQDLPIVDIQLTFNAGSAQDENMGKGLYGIANMAARLMPEGTDQYTAKQLSTAFDALGAKFSVNAYRDMFIVRLRVLSDPNKLEPALDLMLHLIRHANFNQSGLNLVLSNTQIGQKQVQENPARLMNIKFYRALYGQHPYAEPTVGTQASIKKINPQLIQQFRNQFLVAQNLNIAITGQLNIDQATKIADKITQTLPQGQKASAIIEPIDQTDFNIHFIPHASSQAHVTMGHLGINRDDQDRIALEVGNRILGSGSFNSLLSKELRIKRGYTYSVSSNVTSTQARGVFSLNYATQQNQLLDSIDVAHQTLINFIKKPIGKIQLAETKEGLLRAFPMTLSSNANINAQLASIGFYDLPADYLNIYQKKVESLTKSEVQSAIRKHLHADKMTIVVVANELNQDQLKQRLKQNLGIEHTEMNTSPDSSTMSQ